ncbi:hypothetical protein HY408_01210 [Candidatus Gottesmanbacteria bacterium]|nr:hypothetical protein [Candidatus Gottesmanbacteria bacterium]
MDEPLSQTAIKCALNQNWEDAIRINNELLLINSQDIEALNRLAFAYLKIGNISSSKITYKKVLKIDKYNPIALKNLKWMEKLTKQDIHRNPLASPTPTIFLEEPGKTKIISLVHCAPTRVLCNLITAQQVNLIPKKHSIEVRDGQNTYIGALPDDLSHRLLRFILSGNVYDAYVKSVAKNSVILFIRELKKGKRYIHIPSFSVYSTTIKPQDGEPDTDGEYQRKPVKESESDED